MGGVFGLVIGGLSGPVLRALGWVGLLGYLLVGSAVFAYVWAHCTFEPLQDGDDGKPG